ncbi:MAG: ROK family transcriptional regulator, partial [Chloroflexi bacterium]|nr:ROK family transcriptional regulator [Chloroflexota bacterium]
EMLEVNEFLVLDFIRGRDRTTRPEICRALGLAPSTVGRIVMRLAAEGAVVEERQPRHGPGRPPVYISFNRQAGCVLAVDLGGTLCRGAVADLGGDIVDRDVRPTHDQGRPFDTLLASVAALQRIAEKRGLPPRALAIGVPASIDPDTLLGFSGPAVDWEGFDLLPALVQEIDLPFAVENDVNLDALAQAWRGEARRVNDYAVLSIGTGVGGGVVTGGRLLKGRHHAGGELGGIVTDLGMLRQPPWPGGALEGMIAGPALVRRTAELLAAAPAGDPVRTSELATGTPSPERIFETAAVGDPLALRVIDELIEHLAVAIIGIGAILDPEIIILDGGIGRSMGPYLG